ncbi:MAG: S1/P1 nuclease [Thermoanaerobaculia bacterium]
MKSLIAIPLTVFLFAGSAQAYGPRGHGLVGAVADKRLAQNKPAAAAVKQLLESLTLERVATLPDEIKAFDACGKRPSTKPLKVPKRVNDELMAFLAANPCNGHPSHHEFHYTDVPVLGGEKYAGGKVGRSDFDIVHMIPFCVRVLKGEEPETNDRGITKTVAVILLAHYLGDIHQPLHVGAEYFDADGNPFEPTADDPGLADQGGNKLTLFTLVKGKEKSAGKLHSYWDGQTVENAFGTLKTSTIASRLSKNEPENWELAGEPDTWAEQMANEILPVAREAHDRLDFKRIKEKAGGQDITSGRAEERRQSGGTFYAIWAAATVKEEIHKGGWRLAALLEASLP